MSERNDKIDILGVELEWKVKLDETSQQFCIVFAKVPPGVSIPPHSHPDHESFLVLEGQPDFALESASGLEWKAAVPGDLVNIPWNVLHGFRNASGADVRLVITCTAGLGRFFEEAGEPIGPSGTANVNPTPTTVQRVLSIAEKHGQRFVLDAQPS